MTYDQYNQCHQIIHTHAAMAAAGNICPPGIDLAVDLGVMTTMTMLLAGVTGKDINRHMAQNLAIVYLKRNTSKQVLKRVMKFFPGPGTAAAMAMSAAMIEGAGWAMVNEGVFS